jgi:hypothetical protein
MDWGILRHKIQVMRPPEGMKEIKRHLPDVEVKL